MKKERIEELDVAKGLAILLVVLGHSRPPGIDMIYGFHMPLFFILAGIVYKKGRKPKDYGGLLVK